MNARTTALLFAVLLIGLGLIMTVIDLTNGSDELPSEQQARIGKAVERYEDHEAGVICWIYFSGISCLPKEQTALP